MGSGGVVPRTGERPGPNRRQRHLVKGSRIRRQRAGDATAVAQQNLAPSWPSPAHSPTMLRSPLTATPDDHMPRRRSLVFTAPAGGPLFRSWDAPSCGRRCCAPSCHVPWTSPQLCRDHGPRAVTSARSPSGLGTIDALEFGCRNSVSRACWRCPRPTPKNPKKNVWRAK